MSTESLSKIEAIFLDDGGVMNDNERRGIQWRHHLAEYLVPRYGKSHAEWELANTEVITRQFKLFIRGIGFPVLGGYRAARRKMSIEWVRDMFQIVGVPAPRGDEECLRIYRASTDYVIQRLTTDFPGAVQAIRSLHELDYKLYTASGTDSCDIEVFLDGMGVKDLFTQIGGPDLTDTHKGSHHYYEGIMAHAGVSPDNALIVDDSASCVGWATEAGAKAVLISQNQAESGDAVAVLNSLAELPDWLARSGD